MQTTEKRHNAGEAAAEGINRPLRMIRCSEVDAGSAPSAFSSEREVWSATIVIVSAGRLTLDVNGRQTTACAPAAILLSASHRLRMVGCSADFRGRRLAVGEEFMTETDSVDMIYKRIRYGVKLYDKPVVALTAPQAELADARLAELTRAIAATGHLYHREVVLNRLFAFYLDLSDMIDRTEGAAGGERALRHESIVKRFIELLRANYRAEHKVEFYASRLNLSAHYLTSIVKEVTGRSVSDFIFGMLYSDARTLLAESRMSVQEITATLNFSDQSAFGKFFKRHAGVSPLDYRKKRP